jgi:L-aspartate oxidase
MTATPGAGTTQASPVDFGGGRAGMPAGHLVVVGSGIAGLYSALLAAESGLSVTLLSKGALAQSNTHFAQGGICAVLGPDDAAPGDTVEAHIADTLKAGAGQCDPEAVRILCSEAVADITALERFGVVFDTDPATGTRALGLEGAHSAARILHAGGDATGAAIADALIAAVRLEEDAGRIRILEHSFMQDILTSGGRTTGVVCLTANGASVRLSADAVLLASGGAGQLFGLTTNPAVATADGLAAAWRAGAVVADLEYFQFHPTALAVGDNFLVSEAVRGAGAVLRDARGDHFMPRYHPDGDLAPRDVVSRSIADHLASTGAGPGATVYLDATGVEAAHGAGYLARRFPTIDAMTRALGFDWTREWLPVVPAAHYWMGGVATDLDGRTSLPGLYAAGEVACTGVHGANRLASNSLLEGLVFGRRAVRAFLAESTDSAGSDLGWPVAFAATALDLEPGDAPRETAGPEAVWSAGTATVPARPANRGALRELMGATAGVVRDASGLAAAAGQLASWRKGADIDIDIDAERSGVAAAELDNLLLAGSLLVHAAQSRHASAGAHYRSDSTTAKSQPQSVGRASHYWVAHPNESFAHDSTSLPALESETV